MLIFGLHSTSDDWPSDPSNESQPKCKEKPPKSLKNEMPVFDQQSYPSNESQPKGKKGPLSHQKMRCSFWIHSTSGDWPSDPSNESQSKCKEKPPKSLKNEMPVFGLLLTSDDQPSDPSDES